MIQLSHSSHGPKHISEQSYSNGFPQTASLFVEEYESSQNVLLLEFVHEDEYLYFVNRDSTNSNITLNGEVYRPTMLKVYNCYPNKEIKENRILEIQMNSLIRIAYSEQNLMMFENSNEGVTVFGVIQNGQQLAEVIDNPETCSIRNTRKSDLIPDSFFRQHFGFNHFTNPINNSYLTNTLSSKLGGSSDSCVSLDVWNVGQGNSNRLIADNNVILYDIGAPKNNTYAQIRSIHSNYLSLMGNSPALFISHWDTDHYNQLCIASSSFISSIKCIVFPAFALGVTARQVLLKIKNANCCISIAPPIIKSKNHINEIINLGYISIYIGSKSSSKNLSGILVRAKGSNSYSYLTGDNTNWSELLLQSDVKYKEFINVVVPHHGGPSKKILPASSRNKAGSAAVSVGPNQHKHPILNTLYDYIQNGYSVIRTDSSGDISINL